MPKLVIACLVSLSTISCYGADPPCEAPPRWFELPPIESDYHEPTRGNECEFYQFAWQTFLFIIQPKEYESLPQFLSFHTPEQLFGQPSTPQFPSRAGIAKNRSYRLMLTPRLEKSEHPKSLASVTQAVSNSTLIDQSGRAVYYAQHVNKRFEDFVLKYIKDKATGRIDPSKLQTIAAYQGFPEGCIELKSSWKIAKEGDDDSFFTIDAGVAPFKVAADGMNLEVDLDPDHIRSERVALVGMHVVATTINHSEFIWATFEHKDNAPPVAFGLAEDQPVDNSKNYTFYKQGTVLKNCNLGNRGRLRFTNGNGAGVTDQLIQVDSSGGPERLTQVCGSFAFGAAPESATSVAEPDDEVDSLNKSVCKQMPTRFGVWKNYALRGAVWIDDPDQFKPDQNYFQLDEDSNPNAPSGNNGAPQHFGEGTVLRGEHRLSNPTMETFTQGKELQTNTQRNSNCFSCHKTTSESPSLPNPKSFEIGPKLVNVSHIIVNGLVYPKQAEAESHKPK